MSAPAPVPPREAGFTILESLIALAIIAVTLIPICDMQISLLEKVRRQDAVRQQVADIRNGLVLLQAINVMERPAGRIAIGSGRYLRWSAVAETRVRRSLQFLQGEGSFDVALFRVSSRIEGGIGSTTSFEVEQVGWKQVRG